MRANYAVCYSSKQDITSLSGWMVLFYSFFALSGKWHWFAGMHVTCVLWGTLAIAGGHQTSLDSLLEGFKTLHCEKKPWKASFGGWFGSDCSILAPQSKRDTASC